MLLLSIEARFLFASGDFAAVHFNAKTRSYVEQRHCSTLLRQRSSHEMRCKIEIENIMGRGLRSSETVKRLVAAASVDRSMDDVINRLE